MIFVNSGLTLNHGHVVGSIPDGQGDSFLVLLDQLNHLGFLFWSHPTTYHS